MILYSWVAPPLNFGQLNGYLRKKSKNQHWQKRWFEANDYYLTYYKDQNSEKLLACIDLRLVTEIDIGDGTLHPEVGCFFIKLAGRTYVMKAKDAILAQQWVDGLRVRQGGYKSYESNKAIVLTSLEDISKKKLSANDTNVNEFAYKKNESNKTSLLFSVLFCSCFKVNKSEKESVTSPPSKENQQNRKDSTTSTSNNSAKKNEDILTSAPRKTPSSDITVSTGAEIIKTV